MQITEKNASGLKREYNVVIAASIIEERMTARLTEVGKTVNLPGFRPGKAPMNLLRKRFGQSVMGEVLDKAINDTAQSVIAEKSLKPAMQPKIELVNFAEGKDLEFDVKVEVLPEIASPDFKKVELEKLTATVTDEEVTKALDEIVASNRTAKSIAENRKSKKGDVLLIDFVGKLNDVAFEGGTGFDTQLELGSGQFIPGFEDQLIGVVAGDKAIVKVKFPEDYGAKELAGKDAVFNVTVKEIQEYETPKLDDDFAKKLGEDSLESLKAKTRELIQQSYDRVSRMRLKRSLLDKLSDMETFAVPEGMVDAEFDAIWRQIEQAKASNQLDPEDAKKSDDDLRKEYRAIAERRVRLGLLLSDVGQKNNISVTPEELGKAVMEQASRFRGQEQAVVNYYKNTPEALESLRAPVFEDKVVDFVLELAKVSSKQVSVEELQKDPDAPAA
ncbi:MAG: trigger factor [Rhodospirillaceae bacterium]|nr:trigger factor [Rhodospirillaceae bacterium]